MPHGDLIDNGARPAIGSFSERRKLIDATTATTDGVWVDARGFKVLTVEVVLAATGTVQLRGSNAAAKPADSAHGNQIGTDITTSGFTSITAPPAWFKARVTAAGGQVDVLANMVS